MKSVLSFVVLLLTSALLHAEPAKAQLIGHWRYADEQRSAEITFRDDGTYSSTVGQGGKVVLQMEGKWSLSGDTLNYLVTKSSLERVAVGIKDVDKMIELTKDYFIIEAQDGARRKYVRIP